MKKSKKKIVNLPYKQRVIKRLRNIFRAFVGIVAGLYLLSIALLHIPAVQNGIASFTTSVLKDILHTEISIGKVDLGFFNRVILNDILIKDQQNKDLLKAARLSAKIELMPLLHGKISVSNIQFYGFDLRLYQQSQTDKPNFQFLIDTFSSKKKGPSHTHLRINSILIRRGKVSWHRLDCPPSKKQFNPNHIELSQISATLSLKLYTPDSLNLKVKKIAFNESCGLQLKHLAFNITANQKRAEMTDFHLELPQTRVSLSPLRLRYELFTDERGKSCYRNVGYEGGVIQSVVSLSDVASLFPLPDRTQTPPISSFHLNTHFKGDMKSLTATQLSLHSDENDIILDAPTTVSQLQDKNFRTIRINIKNLLVTPNGMELIAAWNKKTSPKAMAYLSSLGTLQASGTFSYNASQLKGKLKLQTSPGTVFISGNLHDDKVFETEVHTAHFNLGKLTGKEEKLGNVSFRLKGNGILNKNHLPFFSTQGEINHLFYNGHDYQSLQLEAKYKNGTVNGAIAINDPHVALSAEGEFNTQCPLPYVKAKAFVSHFAPHALALTSKYEGTSFQGDLQADFQGNDIEDMAGTISLDKFRMTKGTEEYTLGPIIFRATQAPDRRTLSLHSDFLQAAMEGDFHLNTLIAHSRQLLHGYLPSFIKSPNLKKDLPNEVMLSMQINNTAPLEKVLGIPLQIPQTGFINGYFNSGTSEFDFNAAIPSLSYNGQVLDSIQIMAGLVNDSIVCNANFKKDIGKSPVDFDLQTRAAHDHVYARINWNNHGAKNYQGAIMADTRFSKDENRKLLTDISFMPSQIIVNDSIWNVYASHIHSEPGTFNIRKFTIKQGDRHLILDGKVSKESSDSLIADLKDINLEYIFNIVNFHTVEFGGMATGKVYATQLMTTPEVTARLHVQDCTFNNAYMGNMNVNAGWGKETNAVSLQAHMLDPAHRSMTHVDGEIRIGAPPKGGIDLSIKTENIDLSFLNHYTSKIFDKLDGRASGWTRVFGPFKGINLEGDMMVHEGRIKISSTGVEYRLINDSVILRPDNIHFHNAMIYDRQGMPGNDSHYAVVNGTLHHTHLSHMRFDFDIDAYNILGYDIREFGDDTFYGTAYATGKVGFHGKTGELNIDINARPEAGTEFVYNLASPTTITDSQFITYKTTVQDDTPTPSAPHPQTTETDTDMRLNFNLNLTPDATMKILMDPKAGDYISLNGHGNIRAGYYNKGDFTVYGTYTIDQGIYKLSLQDVIRKDFTLNPGGTVIFSGPPTEADLDLQAVYTVPSVSLNDLSARSTFSQNNVRVNCLMNLSGKAKSPQINFDFDIPNVNEDEKQMVRSLISTEEEKNMQVIYLLGIGRFYTYDYTNTEQSQSSVAMKSLLSSTLSGQLNQMLSNIIGNNSNWNIGTNLSTGDVGWSDMDVEGLLSGRLLNNRLLINGNFGYRA